MKRMLTIVGARPQFIKAAVIARYVRELGGIDERIVHTGQHYDENMSDIFFEELEIPPPAFHLGIGSGPHGQQTGRMLESIERVCFEVRPDVLLVYGDTNSTLAGALAATKLHIPIAHVEAGLRSFNRRMPEEINRVVTDHLSTWLFAPTEAAVANLKSEGRPEIAIHLVGDVMYDAALHAGRKADNRVLAKLDLEPGTYILVTIHRAENTDDAMRLRAILAALAQAASEMPIVLPLHPRTRAVLARTPALSAYTAALRVIDPVGYLDMVALEKGARLIATDSGGVQKEAFFHRVPCLTLRDETEWVELVALGWNRVVSPTSAELVGAEIRAALERPRPPEPTRTLYGGGAAGPSIVNVLRAW